MDLRKLAFVGALLGTVGCGDTTTTPGTDGGSTAGDGGGTSEPVTHTYVISQLAVPDPGTGTPAQAPGFDLDMQGSDVNSTRCDLVQLDYAWSQTNATNVDNQLVGQIKAAIEGALSTNVDCAVNDVFRDGNLFVVATVSDINSFTADSSVSVDLVVAQLAAGATYESVMGANIECGTTSSPDPTPLFSVAAGQSFTTMQAIATDVAGTIVDGRLSITTPTLPISLTFEMDGTPTAFALTLTNARLSAQISAEGLTNGVLGGGLQVQELVDLATEINPSAGPVAGGVLASFADLSPNADGSECAAISAGLTFSAVGATLN